MEIYDKIFVIGFNKTGTSSLHHLFMNLGLNSSHNFTVPVLQEIHDYDYDAFTDRNPSDFKLFYEKYPNSLFVLNTRPMKNAILINL